MRAKITGVVFGAALTVYGGILALQEIATLSAQDVRRRAASRSYKLDMVTLAGAIRRLDHARDQRHDLKLAKLKLELVLQKVISIGDGRAAPSAASQARLDRFARQIVSDAPLNGEAWCLLAELAARGKGFGSEAEQFLQLCYATAPKEFWLVERRLHLAMAVWPLLSDELAAIVTRDMVMIVRGYETRHWTPDLLAYAAGVIAPQNAKLIRAIIATNQPALLKQYDGQFKHYQRRAMAAAKNR